MLIVGATVLLGLTATIVEPVLVGLVVSTVASPIVSALVPHHLPRPAGAAIVLVGLLALAVLMGILVVGGITSQAGPIGSYAERAADKAAGWLEDAGVSSTGAADVKQSAETDVPSVIATLTSGVAKTIQTLTSLAFFLSFTLFSIFFLLKDGPKMRRWIDRHLGVPTAAAQVITAT